MGKRQGKAEKPSKMRLYLLNVQSPYVNFYFKILR